MIEPMADTDWFFDWPTGYVRYRNGRREVRQDQSRQVSTQQNLTSAEREAIAYYLGTGGPYGVDRTLVALLSRTGTDAAKTGDDAAKSRDQSRKTPERDRLTAAERGAVDRARIAFRDMDHNAMTMQQLEDYEALCGLLARLSP